MRIYVFVVSFILSVCISAVALAKPVSFEHYSRLPAVYDAALSPDGKFMAAVIDNQGEYILRVFNLADNTDKTMRAAGIGAGVEVNWVYWPNNDQILLNTQTVESTVRGDIHYRGYLRVIDKDVTDIKMLVDPEMKLTQGSSLRQQVQLRQFSNTVINLLPSDPDHILMSYSLKGNYQPDVRQVNVRTRKTKKIKAGHKFIQHWTTDLRGEVRVGEGRKENSGDQYMTIRDAHSDTWTEAQKFPGLKASTAVYGFMENPNEMIIGDHDGKDTRGLFVYDLAQKKRTRKLFQHELYDVTNIIKSADGKKVVGAIYFADTPQRVFFDAAYKTKMDKLSAELDGFQIRFVDASPNGDLVLFKASSPSVPPSLMMYNFKTANLTFIAEDYPEIGDTVQGNVVKATYKARDGYKIPSYVTLPSKVADGMPLKNLPFIIMPHGGPGARDTQSFDAMAQLMASRGYGVLQMNFRGSTGLGSAHRKAGRENWEVMQEDVEDGTRWLVRKGYADPKRVCIVGWSYGGYAALMGAIENSELYACAVSIAGVTDLKDLLYDIRRYRFGEHTAKSWILAGFEDKHDIKKNSPVKRADELKIPLLLAHGTKDVSVHYDQFTRMKKALRNSHAKVRYLTLKDGDHSLKSFDDRRELYEALDEFLNKHLGSSAAAP